MEQQKPKKSTDHDRRNYIIPVFLLAIIMFIACFIWYIYSYAGLRRAIAAERTSFVKETSAQIVMTHRFIREEYEKTVLRHANTANYSNAASVRELSKFYLGTEQNNILLVSENGVLTDLAGNHPFLIDRNKLRALQTSSVTELFASLNNANDFWLFSAPITSLRLDGETYSNIVLAVPQEEYRTAIATSLYDGQGAAYIINVNGGIEMRPKMDALPFGGYNLFVSMLQSGAQQSSIDALQNDLMRKGAGSSVININGTDWLVNYFSFADGAVIVLVPLSITAAQTYEGLARTILSAVCIVLSVGCIVVSLFFFYARRDRERAKAMVAVEAKSEFFSKMSHDIRTPLNAIVGLQTLAMDKNTDPDVADYLAQSEASTRYLLSIVNDVLDMSRIESGKMTIAAETFDMSALLSDIKTLASTMADGKGLHFIARFDSAFKFQYLGDPVRIEQILINILNNAVKFTDAGGTVLFEVEYKTLDKHRDNFIFNISDTGRGISRKFLERIFEPFDQERASTTSDVAGSGLGLAIVHSLVELMHGTVTIKSEEGFGSTFTVTIPFMKGGLAVPVTVASAQILTFPGKRVLVAEDNVINQNIVAKLLKTKLELDVALAGDGARAVEMFQASAPGEYALILMDIKMPVMDGLAAAEVIRALDRPDAKTIPIIALSANMYREDIEKSLAAGMNEHLAKPIDIYALSQAFQRYLQ